MSFLHWLAAFRTAFGNELFMLVTYLGDEVLALVAVLSVFWCVNKKAGYYMIYSALFGLMANQLLKALFAVPRPWVLDNTFRPVEEARATAGGYSFPSGHTATAMAVYGSAARFTKKRWMRVFCIAVIGIVAFSRMYLGVHTPADVGASLAVGTAIVFLLYPVTEAVGNGETKAFRMLESVFLVCAMAFFLFLLLHKPDTAGLTEEELFHGAGEGVENAYRMLGACVGVVVTHWYDRDHPFETEAVWWAQLLKVALGIALVLTVRAVLKGPLTFLFGGHETALAVRYFAMILTAGVLWPMSFRWWRKAGKKWAE